MTYKDSHLRSFESETVWNSELFRVLNSNTGMIYRVDKLIGIHRGNLQLLFNIFSFQSQSPKSK